MKKLAFLIGVGIGFLLGSRTGTGPYRELEAKVRKVTNRPEVQDAVETTKGAAVRQVTDTVNRVSDRHFDGDDTPEPVASIPVNSA